MSKPRCHCHNQKITLIKLAFILGKQGSGKTSRVCKPAVQSIKWWRIARWIQLKFDPITISSNTFNHIELGENNSVELIAGVHENCRRKPINELPMGITILELPHSGYMPANFNEKLLKMGIHSRIFLLELEKNEWLSIGGETGNITSPEYFMSYGRSLSPRVKCDYDEDIQRIRRDISKSRIPSQRFASANTLLKSLKRYVIFGF